GTLDAGTRMPASLDDVMIGRTLALPVGADVVDLPSMAVSTPAGLDVGAALSSDMLAVPDPVPYAITIDAFAEAPSVELAPADVATPKITLQNVAYSEVSGGFFGIPGIVLPNLDLAFTGTTLTLDNSVAYLFSARDVTLDDVQASPGTSALWSVRAPP